MEPFTAAVVQAWPVFLDLERSIEKVRALTTEAASAGARLVVFPEVFLSGYPYWLWGSDTSTEQTGFVELWTSAIDVPSRATGQLGEIAQSTGAVLVIGVNERESGFGRGTLYNSMLTFDANGALVRHHRKVMPTYKERTVWGMGDGAGLAAVDTSVGRLGGLICWESYMPLARFHQYAQGIRVHLAVTADESPAWTTMMQAIAMEGRVYVLSANHLFRRSSVPGSTLLSGFGEETDLLNNGGSVIVDPGGKLFAGPLWHEEGILYAVIDPRRVIEQKHSLDVTGHYGRPDLFKLTVTKKAAQPFEPGDS